MSDLCDEWTFNDTQLQNPFSTVCGEYVIFFITYYAKGFTLEAIIFLLNDSGDTASNDLSILHYIKSKYRDVIDTTNLQIVDIPLIFNQIASQMSYF